MRRSDRSLGAAFNALFMGSMISNTGDGLRLAALPLLAAEMTSSPLLVAASYKRKPSGPDSERGTVGDAILRLCCM